MYTETADLYDLIYSQIRDRRTEAHEIAALVGRLCPPAKSVLDVACGTGELALHLQRDHSFAVDGIDLDPEMVKVARAKLGAGDFTEADMTRFDLGRTYDVVLCLFSSIGYARTTERLGAAIQNMAQHVAENGILLVEPWFTAETFKNGFVSQMSVSTDDLEVTRMTYSRRDGARSHVDFHYLVGDRDGIRHLHEHHEMGLFTEDEMLKAFQAAGLSVTFDPQGTFGRGLYVAQRT